MPHGYDSVVGERGDTPSGGQPTHRHRRAVIRDSQSDPRRAGTRHRVRTASERGPGAADEGPYSYHDCAPLEHHP
jgi:hypothetical protein